MTETKMKKCSVCPFTFLPESEETMCRKCLLANSQGRSLTANKRNIAFDQDREIILGRNR